MYKALLPTDINNDGQVNISDIGTAALAFGSSCRSHDVNPRWNCEVDINMDFKVDIVDIASIAMDFGAIY